MSSQRPEPGDIINYRYLWRKEAEKGLLEGSKPRPAVVIATFENAENHYEVYLLPITHSPTKNATDTIELSATVAKTAGLDEEKNFVNLIEMNCFIWKGFDVEPRQNTNPKTEYYGRLERHMLTKIQTALQANRNRGKFNMVKR